MTNRIDEVAARVRAAHGYSGLKQSDLAQALGISRETLSRWLNARDKPPSSDDLNRLAGACGVPRTFMEVGFAPLEQPLTDTDRRILELEQRLERLESRDETQEFIDDIIERLERSDEAGPDLQEVLGLMRAAHAALTSLAGSEGASSTRGGADATLESRPAPGEGTRRSDERRSS